MNETTAEAVTVAVASHGHATEGLIIVSHVVFFVTLFFLLKHGLVDRRGITPTRENALQLSLIVTGILALLGLLMIPMWQYKYAHAVFVVTVSLIFLTLCLQAWGPTPSPPSFLASKGSHTFEF